jgi:hypothetical protein
MCYFLQNIISVANNYKDLIATVEGLRFDKAVG